VKEYKILIILALIIAIMPNVMAATIGGNSSIYTFEVTNCQADYTNVGCNQTTIRYECDINNPQFIEGVQFEIIETLYTATKSGNTYHVDYIKPDQTSTINETLNHTDVYITDTNQDVAHYENNYTSVQHECNICTDTGYIEECSIFDNQTVHHIYEPYGCEADYNETLSCNYCIEDVEQILGECWTNNTQTVSYADYNYETCCVITGIISDCSILFPPYNTNTTQVCEYTCDEIWQPITTCDVNNDGFLYYEQITNCTIIDELPIDNGTNYECSYEPEGMQIGYDNYMAINTAERIDVIITENGSRVDNETQYVEINFDNATYMMQYDVAVQMFYIYITETIERDIPFTILYWNSYNSNNTKNGRGVMKWRDSFEIELEFYKQDINNPTAEPIQYKNEFQYVYMLPARNGSIISTDRIGNIDYLEDMVDWMPGYGGQWNYNSGLDMQTAFWGKYTNGKAEITLYETGNYTLHIISNTMVGGTWQYEFVYPQFESAKYKSKIADIQILDKANTTYSVYMDAWEVFKFKMMMNIMFWIVAVLIYFGLLVIILKSGEGIKIIIPATIAYFTMMKILGVIIF